MSRVFDREDMRRIALAERSRIQTTLFSLRPEHWAVPSLCEGWSVRDVAAHLVQRTWAGLLWRQPSRCVVHFVVHHQDIRRPLGLGRDVPEEAVLAALQAVTTEAAFAADFRRATGLRLVATDVSWTHGDGPVEVHGRAEALLLAIMGRPVEDELSGPAL